MLAGGHHKKKFLWILRLLTKGITKDYKALLFGASLTILSFEKEKFFQGHNVA